MPENRFAALLEELHPKERAALARSASVRRYISYAKSTPVKYRVPGTVPHVKQPTSNTCWATVATMLMSWHDKASMDIETAMKAAGQEFVDLYKANKTLPTDRKAAFLAAIGLQAEPPMSFSIAGWEQLLRRYKPLWVTTDDDPSTALVHGRVIVGIEGDGTPRGTKVFVHDPLKDGPTEETFEAFVKKYENVVRPTGPLKIQVVHYPEDAGRATQQSYAFTRYSEARGPEAVVAGVALGYEILKDIGGTMGSDIKYEREKLEGRHHPFDDPSWGQKGTYQEKKFRVRKGVWVSHIGDEQSLEFDVNYWTNGHSIGPLRIVAAKENDAAGWELRVDATITALPGGFQGPNGPMAGLRLTFTYRHESPLQTAICTAHLSLWANGQIHVTETWTQS